MAVAKKEFFDWLATTKPPRRLTLDHPSRYDSLYEVGCDVGALVKCRQSPGCSGCDPKKSPQHGKTLAGARKYATAVGLRSKYYRWLQQFQAAEAETTP